MAHHSLAFPLCPLARVCPAPAPAPARAPVHPRARAPAHPQVLLLETGEKAEFFLHQHAELPHHVSVIALLAPHSGAVQDAQYAEATKAFAEAAVEMRIEGYARTQRVEGTASGGHS